MSTICQISGTVDYPNSVRSNRAVRREAIRSLSRVHAAMVFAGRGRLSKQALAAGALLSALRELRANPNWTGSYKDRLFKRLIKEVQGNGEGNTTIG